MSSLNWSIFLSIAAMCSSTKSSLDSKYSISARTSASEKVSGKHFLLFLFMFDFGFIAEPGTRAQIAGGQPAKGNCRGARPCARTCAQIAGRRLAKGKTQISFPPAADSRPALSRGQALRRNDGKKAVEPRGRRSMLARPGED